MNEIDLHVAPAYLHREPWWTWQIPVYLFLGGLAAGIMVLTALRVAREPGADRSAAFRGAAWLAPLLLSLGMASLFWDLANRWHVLRFYLAFRPAAPMSWGAWILLAVYPFAVLFALGELPARWRARLSGTRVEDLTGRSEVPIPQSENPITPPGIPIARTGSSALPTGNPAGRSRDLTERRRWIGRLIAWADDPVRKRRLAVGNIVVGAALGLYTGILLSVMAARPLWNSAVLGPLFLVSGLSTGAAAILLLGVDPRERRLLGRIDAGLIAAELVLIGLLVIGWMNGGAVRKSAGELLMGGPYTAAFWSLVVIAGLAVPLIAEIWEMRGRGESRWFTPLLVLVGGLALRWILVSAGQVSSWASL